MNMNALQVQAENIIAPVRGDMLEASQGDERLIARIAATFSVAIRENPDLLKCKPESIQTAIIKAAADGLMPDNKEAAIIPYKGIAQYQPMVAGIIRRLRELGSVHKIVVNTVHDKDQYVFNLARQEISIHNYDMRAQDRGEIIGAYCIFMDKAGEVMHLETMQRHEIEQARRASKAPDSPAWRNWFGEMAKKVVLRRAAKYITIDNSRLRDMIERLDEMFPQYRNVGEPERRDPFSGAVESREVKAIESAAGVPPAAAAQEGAATPRVDPNPQEQSAAPSPSGPPMTIQDAIDLSGFLWGSNETAEDMKVDMQQFKVEKLAGKAHVQEVAELMRQVGTIHMKRVRGDIDSAEALKQLEAIGVVAKEDGDAAENQGS
jgi:phage RecT family recombinase